MQNKAYKIEDENHLSEVIVSWIITHRCQEDCGYCISPSVRNEIRLESQHVKIQDKLIQTGLTKVRYIGGEPLMIKHLSRLIIAASEKGLDTRLSTNGILLTESRFDEIKNFLDSVAFPFESLNDDLNEQIRKNYNHRQIVSSRISMIKSSSNIGVLINTCVHKENINELVELGKFLYEQGVDHWKLRRFSSTSGRGAVKNKKRFDITDSDFYNQVELLQNLYPKFQIDGRMPSKLATRLMVSPKGDLYRMLGYEEENIHYGNVLYDNLNIREIYTRDHCN